MNFDITSQTSVTVPVPRVWLVPTRVDPSYISEAATSVRQPRLDPGSAAALAPRTTVEKRAILLKQLRRSVVEAAANELDLPSDAAVVRAEGLVSRLVIAVEDSSMFEVFVADDGTIEITATPPGQRITIDVAPTTARTALIVQDATGTTLWADLDASDSEVVRQVERAA